MAHVTANTHPFPGDGMAFAHNGHIDTVADLDALVAASDAPLPSGDTDSERYFSLLRADAGSPSTDRSLLATAQRITRVATATSLNALVLTRIAPGRHRVVARAGQSGAPAMARPDRDYRLWYASRRTVWSSPRRSWPEMVPSGASCPTGCPHRGPTHPPTRVSARPGPHCSLSVTQGRPAPAPPPRARPRPARRLHEPPSVTSTCICPDPFPRTRRRNSPFPSRRPIRPDRYAPQPGLS